MVLSKMIEVENPITNISDHFPKNIHFSITNRCNLLCSFCGQNKKKWTREEELTFDDYRILLDQVAVMKDRTVSFSGGEIFVHPHIEKILAYCSEKKITISMILTNGTLLKEKQINALIDASPAHIGFSLDGTEEVHDQVRGIKGSYAKTIAAIESINRIKKEKGLSRPSVGVNFVMTGETMGSMEPIIDHLANLKLSGLRFQYLTYISEKKVEEHKKALKQVYPDYDYCYWDKFINISTPFDTSKLVENMDKAKKRGQQKKLRIFFSFNFNDREIEQWYNSDEVILHKCAFLKSFLILPNGDLPLCDFIRYPVGNVRERSMEELWKEEKGQKFRKMIRKKLLPGCERCCQLT
jgi:MoaA/NifB/PqqE/SkfB family radical SAM enzyme